ncbi:hypothetical protein G3A_22150 [Bacillus sp. 17376]|uniref:hypothetical protein n=1 Tax=Mesobacillus boroniphilus TaxID=308892 RepID=UPI0003C7D713|nr:hypothetical protein [Mesobacillus boroniphilus]ESU30296.1 hypothetical protein G3A_22150 [Bacillus sp. 17376]
MTQKGECRKDGLTEVLSYNQNKKRKRLVQPRQALEGRPVKSFFDFIARTEATRGARRWSWTLI